MKIEINQTELKAPAICKARLSENKFSYIWLTSFSREPLSAQQTAHAFKTRIGPRYWGRQFHFAVGEDGIFASTSLRYAPTLFKAYQSKKWPAKENGVIINMCALNLEGGKVQRNGVYPGWYFGEKTLAFAAELIAELMDEYSIPFHHVKRHSEYNPECYYPAPFSGTQMVAKENCSRAEYWSKFLCMIKKELEHNGKQ